MLIEEDATLDEGDVADEDETMVEEEDLTDKEDTTVDEEDLADEEDMMVDEDVGLRPHADESLRALILCQLPLWSVQL